MPSEIQVVQDEIITGIQLPKCQQCGCMRETLEQVEQVLPGLGGSSTELIKGELPGWQALMKPARYSCLGCEHCYAGVAQNAFTEAFPQVADSFGLSCVIQSSPTAVSALITSRTLARQGIGRKVYDYHA